MPKRLEEKFQEMLTHDPRGREMPPEAVRALRMAFFGGAFAAYTIPATVALSERAEAVADMVDEMNKFGMVMKGETL
jgi:hypothetical protein